MGICPVCKLCTGRTAERERKKARCSSRGVVPSSTEGNKARLCVQSLLNQGPAAAPKRHAFGAGLLDQKGAVQQKARAPHIRSGASHCEATTSTRGVLRTQILQDPNTPLSASHETEGSRLTHDWMRQSQDKMARNATVGRCVWKMPPPDTASSLEASKLLLLISSTRRRVVVWVCCLIIGGPRVAPQNNSQATAAVRFVSTPKKLSNRKRKGCSVESDGTERG